MGIINSVRFLGIPRFGRNLLTERLPKRGGIMPQGRISKRSVDSLTCPVGKDRIFLWDDALAGFSVTALSGCAFTI
jgi:hypothetical protein